MHAPPHRAGQEEKDEFYSDLQSVIESVAEEDVLMIVETLTTE